MIQAFFAKKMVETVMNKIIEKPEIKRMRKYVEEENNLDIGLRATRKQLSRLRNLMEKIELTVAKLMKNTHPPIFAKDDYDGIIKRINKLEKRRR